MIDSAHGDIIQWLRGFYYIAQTGSIRRAAEMMNRTPSTLSYQLKCLEEELETVLFDRDSKRLKITPEGEKLMTWTISTFEALKGMKAELSARPGHLQGQVFLSTVLPLATKVISAVSQYHRINPLVHIDIRRDMADGVIRDVEEARADFGLISTATPPEHCFFDDLFTSRPLLILPKEHGFALPEHPSMDDLKNLPFVSYLKGAGSQHHSFTSSCNIDSLSVITPVLSVNNYHLMIHYVMHGMGCALLDEVCLQATIYGGIDLQKLHVVSMEHLFPRMHHGIIIRKKKHLSPQAKELLRHVREGLLHFQEKNAGNTISPNVSPSPGMESK